MVGAVRPEDNQQFELSCPARKPTAQNIYTFIATLYGIGQWTPECNMLMMVLIAKAIRTGRLAFNSENWDMVCLVALLLAQKTWDDLHLKNADFLAILWNFEDYDER
jgi:hypothetical protein